MKSMPCTSKGVTVSWPQSKKLTHEIIYIKLFGRLKEVGRKGDTQRNSTHSDTECTPLLKIHLKREVNQNILTT